MPFRPMSLRGKRVFARCGDDGELVVDGGRVEIRYKPKDGRAYRAGVANLSPLDEPIVSDAHVGEASPVESKGKGAAAAGGSKSRSSGKTKKAAAGGTKPPEAPAPGEVLAYCDGACSGNPGPAGVGVVVLWDDERWELSEYLGQATNNIGELKGILRACERTPDPGRPLRIYTDSTYAIGVLQKGWKAKANTELVAACKAALAALDEVSLHYVKGHAGIPLNEVADSLAVAAVERRGTTDWRRV